MSFTAIQKKKKDKLKPSGFKGVVRGANVGALQAALSRLEALEQWNGVVALDPIISARIEALESREATNNADVTDLENDLANKSPNGHNHGGVYLTEAEARAVITATLVANGVV